jgi:hypothetical protein
LADERHARISLPRKAALVAVLLVTAACGSTSSDASDAAAGAGTVAWQHENLTFNRPADWTWVPLEPEMSTKHLAVLGYLATIPIDPDRICKGNAKRPKCNFANYHLQPGTLAVTIMAGQGLSSDVWQDEVPADATELTVGGMPALFREKTGVDDRVIRSWTVARPDAAGGWYQISAETRGPGEEEAWQQLDALIGSVAFEPAVAPLPTDKRSLTEMAFEAMQRLRDRRDGPDYDCFLDRPGTRPGVVERLPGAPPLFGRLPVSCSFRAEATRWNMWRLRLRYSWAALGDRPAGSWTVTQWVTAEGKLGPSSSAGDEVP